MKFTKNAIRSLLTIAFSLSVAGLPAPGGVYAGEADAPAPASQKAAPADNKAVDKAAEVKVGNVEPEAPKPVAADDENDVSLLGSYLAGRVARGLRDHDAAAEYFGRAYLLDPKSDVLLEQTFVLELSRGNWKRSFELAKEVVKRVKTDRFGRLVLGLKALVDKDYDKAEAEFSRSDRRSPLGKAMGIIADSWLMQAKGNSREALNNMKKLERMSWAKFYQDYHTAMIADQAGRHSVARKNYERLFEKDPHSLRLMAAYVRHLAATGARKEALDLLATHKKRNGDHPLILDLEKRINDGEKLKFVTATPNDGLAELYYGIGDALTGDGGVDLGMIYLQAGLLLRPDLPLASLALAEAYEETNHFEQANRIYDKIDKNSPLWPNAAVRRAFDLNSLEKVDEAKASLDELIARYPNDIMALEAQGNILRAHKRYQEAVGYYTKAIALLPTELTKGHWKYFYSRGVCYERLKQWPKAEVDLEKARALDPSQPLVLNYLGYSWVDQGLYLSKAMQLIRKAVALKPDDGYFVDSLGWAFYRLGNYDKAVAELERAVELKPDDPVINDHLGDAYWQVGRKLEAGFQWSQSLTLKPEAEDVPRIEAKIADGLKDPKVPAQMIADAPGEVKNLKNAVESATDQNVGERREHTVKSGESLWSISKRYYGDGRFNVLLRRANQLMGNDNGDLLQPGMKLIIPPMPQH